MTYYFDCPLCGEIILYSSVADRDKLTNCPDCKSEITRIWKPVASSCPSGGFFGNSKG